MSERLGRNCLLCGAVEPPGHVIVHAADGSRAEGRVCSSHTLKELILDSSERFMVEVTVTTAGVEALERAQARLGTKEERHSPALIAARP